MKLLFNFGEHTQGVSYKTVDEHVIRLSAMILLLLSLVAFTNGFMMRDFELLPYLTGFMMINFFMGVVINVKFAPTMIIAKLLNKKEPLPIGAVQKHFAWSLGLFLSSITFILSLFLLDDVRFFEPLCMLCIFCTTLLYFEAIFNVCIGCKLYHLALKMKLLKEPQEKPKCMGDSCEIDDKESKQ